MRVPYTPESTEDWEDFFHQTGHGFNGIRYQRGGAGFGGLFNGFLNTVLPLAKSAGKAITKEALRTGITVASDALAGQDFRRSLKENSLIAGSRLMKKAKKKLPKKKKKNQKGYGIGQVKYNTNNNSKIIKRKKPGRKPISHRKRQPTKQSGVYYI